MLRKGLAALMMGVICAGSAMAEDSAARRPSPAPAGLMGWLKSKTSGIGSTSAKSALRNNGKSRPTSKPMNGGIERAVVRDAERQAITVRQTSGFLQNQASSEPNVQAAEGPLQPVPVQQAPVLPNISTTTGPQYFSAVPAGMSNPVPVYPSNNWQAYEAPKPVHMVSQGPYSYVGNPASPASPAYAGAAPMQRQANGMYSATSGTYAQTTGSYPQTGAALYPAPIPGIPHQVGGIAIENPAFHPHEMLHQHRYKAMYPPYYYKVNGGWMVTPFGVWSHEDWKLQGTQVDVKYKSHISPFTLFHPPVHR